MADGKQGTQVNARDRRAFFGTALGLGAGLGATAGLAQTGSVRNPISWVHGNNATVLDAQGLERDRVVGNARVVHGRSWSTLPLHFAVPPPVMDTGVPLRVAAIWVRLKAERGAMISTMTLHDCERTVAHKEKMEIRQEDWGDVRVALDQPCFILRSVGLTLECTFADVDRQIAISAIGCEFEMEA